ncbi:9044_t:CDS:10 [Racocetra persica]|uniref:9044_t:CDS:1 n=1 Tax=Racocetra persica TaxID=160502 RepID=A0ACA9K8C9_9GLOM|nr:9044_t:CDS:10 [Racocetra persica]
MRELEKYRKDPHYKRYVQQVEKILQSFDKEVNEWADFISFLGKLLRAFQAYPQFPVIPRKLLVAKRLSQSLNPGLPPGVHQKALEVYEYIFKNIGIEQLADDLPIYSQGLFQFFQYSAMSVKPQLIELFEQYMFPLKERLRPVMKAFIIALLPGLEEEGGEFFDKVLSLLDYLSGIVEKSYFLQSMWLVLITCPTLRTPALSYLSRRMPKISSKEDVAVVLGDDVGIMVRAFSATLGDKQVLVQRAILELLVVNFPLKVDNFGDVLQSIMQQDDLILLMKSATSVVLRKDMSLNRRLYAWLLGPDDHIEQQIDHFQVYAKSAVVSALKGSFFMDAADLGDAQRPYKILISLMDKWEIGQPIVQELFIDVLWSLKNHVDKSEFGMDLLQTANMFMEMLEPYLIWMKLYGLLDKLSSKDGLDTAALDLVGFVLDSIKLHEEEIEQIHLPLFLTALLCKLQSFANDSKLTACIPQVESALKLALDIFQKIPNSVFNYRAHKLTTEKRNSTIRPASQADKIDSSNEDTLSAKSSQMDLDFSSGMDPMMYINNFYLSGNENIANKESSGIRGRSLVEELLKAIQGFLNCIITKYILIKSDDNKVTQGSFSVIMDRACGLLRAVSMKLYHTERDTKEYESVVLKLYTGEWVNSLLKCCHMVENFDIIDSALSTLLDLIVGRRFIPPRLLDSKQQIRDIIDTLWRFLGPRSNVLHLRSSQLIWKLKDVSHANYVEAVISEYLIQKETSVRLANFERFGIFWMLSAEFYDTDTAFSQQMFLVLDSLRDENPSTRRAGETWMRWNRNHKSFIRILQPMVKILCESKIIRKNKELQINDGTFEVVYYEKPFNQAQVDYVFETLSTMCRVGGKAFLNAIHISLVKAELVNSCAWLSRGNENSLSSMTYSELFIRTALLYIGSEVLDTSSSMNMLNQHIHMHAAEFLHHLVKNSEFVSNGMVYLVHETVLRKMLYCIYAKQLDLQAKLLPLLRSTILNQLNEHFANGSFVSNSPLTKKITTEPYYSSSPTGHTSSTAKEEVTSDPKHFRALTLLFAKVLTMALSKLSNRPLLQEWMDLIETSIPYFRQSFNSVLMPLIQCICEQLRHWKTETQHRYALMISNSELILPNSSESIDENAMSDWDIITLFNGFEEIVKDCLNKHTTDDGDIAPHGSKSFDTTLGLPTLTGYVTGVFSVDYGVNETSTSTSEQQKPRDYILYNVFPNIVAIILDIWTVFKDASSSNRPIKAGICPFDISLAHTEARVKNRIKILLEELYKKAHAELVEAFVELWYIENPDITAAVSESSKGFDSTAIEVLKVIPGSSVPKVINTLLINARGRSLGVQAPKVKKSGSKTIKLTDIMILRFIEAYCDSLGELEPLTKVWPQCISYVKDHFAQATTYKYLFPNILRFMHGLADKLCTNEYFDDKKVRKDMQDVYQRVLDYCILISGRSFDQGLWLRRSTPLPEGEDENTEETDENESEKSRVTAPIQEDKKASYKSKEEILIEQTNQYLAAIVIPNIKKLLADHDKIVGILTNLMYYVIAPSLKNRTNTGINPIALDLLCETSKISFAYRVWRKEAWDVFIDNKFFNMPPVAAKKWRIIMQTIMTSEKERFAEVLTRITTTPANALFVNKEQESLNRALNLRRLSFIIYCGKMDQYLSQIPNIHEKLVELFKLGFTELVHAELRLCGTYFYKETSTKESSKVAAEKTEVANTFLAACKFLDLLFVLQTNSFQPYEWMFISNTINVVRHSLEYSPYALLDKIADQISGHEDSKKLHLDNLSNNQLISWTHAISPRGNKRPMLTLHSITSIKQLEFFVRNISLYVYHSTYTLAKPDMPYIESLLENDLLEYSGGLETGNLDVDNGDLVS